MNRATTIATTARQMMSPLSPWAPLKPAATAVPTTTGTIAAGSVRGRAPASHSFQPVGTGRAAGPAGPGPLTIGSRALRELVEVGLALLHVGVAALLGLFAHV